MMRIGVVYPQTEFGNDPAAIRDYAQTAESLGYQHVLAYDHVLGANPGRAGGWQGPYTHEHPFQEPFALFSFMAAVTSTIEFTTGILILPQRQTALVAKQAATLDVLSGGRLRLGVAVGWNPVEYEALGQSFRTRGRRIEEQITLLRRLWTEPLVTFDGRWDTVPDAGLNPLPVQRPIPIWFGGHADVVLRRLGKMGDGWFPNYRTAEQARPHLEQLAQYVAQAGRSASDVGVEARVTYGSGDPDVWRRAVSEWSGEGVTHLTVNTMGLGFETPQAHVAAVTRFAEEVMSS
jgi:probable F420-dependent oxidoreductase